jgi:hypothetical protein
MSTPHYRVPKWDRFQHYAHRNPPWIKLHAELLDNPKWARLSGDASKLLAECWLLASRYSKDGSLAYTVEELAWALRRDEALVRGPMQELVREGFIESCLPDASAALAPRLQVATTETEAERETETEKRDMVHVPRTVDPWPAKPRKQAGAYLYPEPFEELWRAYPNRDGPNPKVGAYKAVRARVKDGAETDQLVAASRHYAKHCAHRGIEGTEYVQQAATFFGQREAWREFIAPANGNGASEPRPDYTQGVFRIERR